MQKIQEKQRNLAEADLKQEWGSFMKRERNLSVSTDDSGMSSVSPRSQDDQASASSYSDPLSSPNRHVLNTSFDNLDPQKPEQAAEITQQRKCFCSISRVSFCKVHAIPSFLT